MSIGNILDVLFGETKNLHSEQRMSEIRERSLINCRLLFDDKHFIFALVFGGSTAHCVRWLWGSWLTSQHSITCGWCLYLSLAPMKYYEVILRNSATLRSLMFSMNNLSRKHIQTFKLSWNKIISVLDLEMWKKMLVFGWLPAHTRVR